jgi:HK97 gp10 family phage protein
MARARVRITEGELAAAISGPRGLATAYVRRITRQIENRARLYAPVNTGNLRGSITSAVTTRGLTVSGTVGSPLEYAVYVHEGTRPHEIRARTPGGTLTWKAGPGSGENRPGPRMYARRTFHPGTRPQPFLRKAMEDVLATE